MAAPETVELRAMSDADLVSDLEETHQALFNLRFQTVTRQLADVSQVSRARRRIARIKTLLTERDILAEADALSGAQAAAVEETPAASDQPDEVDAPDETAAGAGEADDGDDGGEDDDEDGGSQR